METRFGKKSAKVIVVDGAASRRQLVSDVMRGQGFADVCPLRSGKEALNFLEVEGVDWLIMPLMESDPINALQILKLATETPKLRKLRTTLLLAPGEDFCLPLAFDLGLMSWHNATYNRDQLDEEIKRFLSVFKRHSWNTTLTSAHYLRTHLKDKKLFRVLANFEEKLFEVNPGTPELLLHIAEAQFLIGNPTSADTALRQAVLLNDRIANEAARLRKLYVVDEVLDDDFDISTPAEDPAATLTNALGVETVVLVDPDSSVQFAVVEMLKMAGVRHIEVFNDGDQAWTWLKANPEPDLVLQEWRLAKLAGPLLLQRIRSLGFFRVPIIVVSSLIKHEEVPLVQEMGVATVLEKPFEQQLFFETLIWTLAQSRVPTEKTSLERKMNQLLEDGHRPEAERLRVQYMANPDFPEGSRLKVDAHFAFHAGRYEETTEKVVQALKLGDDTLNLLNLLGKSLLKLKKFAQALECFSRAQNLSPMNVERLCRIAETQQDLNQTDAANATLANATALDYGSVRVAEASVNVALLSGDTAKAGNLMQQMDSLSRILAFMNNRAVALTRSGKFESGIELYQRTLDSLPKTWSQPHDAVSYNLGLACARYGELDTALVHLDRLQPATAGPALIKKAVSLRKRIEQANKTHGVLAIVEGAGPQPPGPAGAAPTTEAPAPTELLEIRRGDLCCHLIFRSLDLANPRGIQLLAKAATFVERAAIEREEVFTQIHGAKG